MSQLVTKVESVWMCMVRERKELVAAPTGELPVGLEQLRKAVMRLPWMECGDCCSRGRS